MTQGEAKKQTSVGALRRLLKPVYHWGKEGRRKPAPELGIGLALGGGFARGIAHAGVLRVLAQNNIPIRYIAGVSAGAIVAAAYASGVEPDEIGEIGCSMRFADVARWTISRMGLAATERMTLFLNRLLKCFRFEEMKIPLSIVATDLVSGEPVVFSGRGDVVLPIRASCSYPGLFMPIRDGSRLLVDGAMAMEIPAQPLRQIGAQRVIAVRLKTHRSDAIPHNMLGVVNRCFQILHGRVEQTWRSGCDIVIEPNVTEMEWDAFGCGAKLLKAGEAAAHAALPQVLEWLKPKPASLPRGRRRATLLEPVSRQPTALSS